MAIQETYPIGTNMVFRKQVIACVCERLEAERAVTKSLFVSLIYVCLAHIHDAKRPVRADIGESICHFLHRVTTQRKPLPVSKENPFGSSWMQRADWYRQSLGYVDQDVITRDLRMTKEVVQSMRSHLLDGYREDVRLLATKLCNFSLAFASGEGNAACTPEANSESTVNPHFIAGKTVLNLKGSKLSRAPILGILIDRRMLNISGRNVFSAFALLMNEHNVQSSIDLTKLVTGGHSEDQELFRDLRRLYEAFRASPVVAEARNSLYPIAGDF